MIPQLAVTCSIYASNEIYKYQLVKLLSPCPIGERQISHLLYLEIYIFQVFNHDET